ncbi:unnamed protein product, partial [Staurois parvus]
MVRSEPGSEQEKSAAVQKQDAGQTQDTGYRAQDKHNTKAESVGLA